MLGIIGGFFGAVFALFMGGVDAALNEAETSSLTGLGWAAFFFSTLTIVAAVVVRSKAKLGGILLLVSAIGGFISISFFFLIPGILILIAAIMGLVRKDKQKSAPDSLSA